MSRRRTRFIVTYSPHGTNEIRTVQSLGYSRESLTAYIAFIEKHYGVVLAIDTARAKAKPTGLVLDRQALKDACDLLGITGEVKVRFHGAYGQTNGTHRYGFARTRGVVASMRPQHRIVIKSYLTPEQATETLWHELTHAMQAERVAQDDPTEWWAHVRREQRNFPYRIRPMELEARDTAARFADCLLFEAAA